MKKVLLTLSVAFVLAGCHHKPDTPDPAVGIEAQSSAAPSAEMTPAAGPTSLSSQSMTQAKEDDMSMDGQGSGQ